MATPEQIKAEQERINKAKAAREAKSAAAATPAPSPTPAAPAAATPPPPPPAPATAPKASAPPKPRTPPKPKTPTPAEVLGFDPLAQAADLNRQLEEAARKADPLAGIVSMPPKVEPEYTSAGYAGEGEAADVVVANPEAVALGEAARNPDLRLQARSLVPEYNWKVSEDQAAKERIALLRQRYEKNGMTPEAALDAARKQTEQETALLRTVGLWGVPMTDKPETVGEAMLPQTTILGVNPEGQVVRAQENPLMYGLRTVMTPGTGLAMAAQQAGEALGLMPESEKQPTPLQMLSEGQGFSDVARRVTPPESDIGRGALALGAAVADVLAPDVVTGVVGAAKGAKAALRVGAELSERAVGRTAAEARAAAARAGLRSETEMLGARANAALDAAKTRVEAAAERAKNAAGVEGMSEVTKDAATLLDELPSGLKNEVMAQLTKGEGHFLDLKDYYIRARDGGDAARQAFDSFYDDVLEAIEKTKKGVDYAGEVAASPEVLLFRQRVAPGLSMRSAVAERLSTWFGPLFRGGDVAREMESLGLPRVLQEQALRGANRVRAALERVAKAPITSGSTAEKAIRDGGFLFDVERLLDDAYADRSGAAAKSLDSALSAVSDRIARLAGVTSGGSESIERILKDHIRTWATSGARGRVPLGAAIDVFVADIARTLPRGAGGVAGETAARIKAVEEASRAVTAGLVGAATEANVMREILDDMPRLPRNTAVPGRPKPLSPTFEWDDTVFNLVKASELPDAFTRAALEGVSKEQQEAFIRIAQRDEVFLPRAVRERVAQPIRDALFSQPPLPSGKLGLEGMASVAAKAALSLWAASVTRLHPRYFLNNAFGNTEQVLVNLGLTTALRHAFHNEFLPGLLPILGVSANKAAGGLPALVASALIHMNEGARTALRAALSKSTMVSFSGIQGNVSKVLDAAGDVSLTIYEGTGALRRVARKEMHRASELYRIAAENGVLDNFDTTMIRDGLVAREGELAAGLAAKGRAGLRAIAEAPLALSDEVAQHIGTRQRVGLYLLLIEGGVPPVDAAKAATSALYDYGAVTEFERGTFMKLVFPWWRWQKNANRQFIGALTNPEASYRMFAYIRGRKEVAELVDQFAYGQDYDEYGVGVGRMSPEEQVRYAEFKPWLSDIRAQTGWSNAEVNAWLRGFDLAGLPAIIGQKDPVSGIVVTQEVVDAIRTAQDYAADMRWKDAAWNRATARVRAVGTERPQGQPTLEDVFTVAMPPSGMEGAMQFMLAEGAFSWTTGAVVANAVGGGIYSGDPLEVVGKNMVDPEKIPLLGIGLEGLQGEAVRYKVAPQIYNAAPEFLLGSTLPPDPRTGAPAVATSPALALALETFPAVSLLNKVWLDSGSGRASGALRFLQLLGVSVGEYGPSRSASEIRSTVGTAKGAPGFDIQQELGAEEQPVEEP